MSLTWGTLYEEMLKRGKEPKEIADFCNYPLELILEVQKNLLVLQ